MPPAWSALGEPAPPTVGTFPLHSTGQEVDPQSNSTALTQKIPFGGTECVCVHLIRLKSQLIQNIPQDERVLEGKDLLNMLFLLTEY